MNFFWRYYESMLTDLVMIRSIFFRANVRYIVFRYLENEIGIYLVHSKSVLFSLFLSLRLEIQIASFKF
jgi:hypothetical protein